MRLSAGRQVYVLYPVIEESKQELKAATAEYERLAKAVFPKLRVGLLHGRLKNDEKDRVMDQFRRGELQILVATTVIEVGVDVPNATVMVIEHADRFGLAQLHQLRGRIGRGKEKSHCILVAPKSIAGDARERIEAMVATSNGFEIAERDLETARPGRILRHPAAWRRGILVCAAAPRSRTSGTCAPRSLRRRGRFRAVGRTGDAP